MDPNANLERIRVLVRNALRGDGDDDETAELADLVEGLDEWLSAGGFLPKAWERRS